MSNALYCVAVDGKGNALVDHPGRARGPSLGAGEHRQLGAGVHRVRSCGHDGVRDSRWLWQRLHGVIGGAEHPIGCGPVVAGVSGCTAGAGALLIDRSRELDKLELAVRFAA